MVFDACLQTGACAGVQVQNCVQCYALLMMIAAERCANAECSNAPCRDSIAISDENPHEKT
jgi:hypothetical protein